MNRLINLSGGTLIVMLIFSSVGVADVDDSKAPQAKVSELKEQTVCPVMGGKINKDIYTDIQGQRVYHCCTGCEKPMKADPDKYFKKAAEAGVRFETVQVLCPISSEPIDEEISTYFEGRTVKFCCGDCLAIFEKDPQKYLTILDKHPEIEADEKLHQEKSGEMEYEGHGH